MFVSHVTAQTIPRQHLKAEDLFRNQAFPWEIFYEQSDIETRLSPSTSTLYNRSIWHKPVVFLTCQIYLYERVYIRSGILNYSMLVVKHVNMHKWGQSVYRRDWLFFGTVPGRDSQKFRK
jgi:hypothetical protein